MILRVAAGVLRRADGAVLIAQRPLGKIAAGSWEFPGGKIESGEAARQALERELAEELGIGIGRARPLIRIQHTYPDRTVELDTWLVEAWTGQPQGLEDQALAWVQPASIWDYDLLPADAPIVDALRLPDTLPVTGAFADVAELEHGIERLRRAGHRLIRLRAGRLSDAEYQRCVRKLAPALSAAGGGLLIDRCAELLSLDGVAGFALGAAGLNAAERAPSSGAQRWLLASCHNAKEMDRAVQLGAQALVLGPVLPTPSHPGQAGLGWTQFAQLTQRVNCPVYAIGGLDESHREQAYRHGAQGLAGIRAYW